MIDYKIEREEKIRNHANTKINKITTSEIMPKVNNPGIIDIKIKPKERIVTKKLYDKYRKYKRNRNFGVNRVEDDNPSDKIAIGIIDSKNRERYIQDDDNLWHGFKIKKVEITNFCRKLWNKRIGCWRLLRCKSIYNERGG